MIYDAACATTFSVHALAARVKFNHLCKLGNRRIFLRVMLYKTFGAGAGPFTLGDDSPAPCQTERRTTCQKTRPKIDVTGGKRERSDKVAVEREVPRAGKMSARGNERDGLRVHTDSLPTIPLGQQRHPARLRTLNITAHYADSEDCLFFVLSFSARSLHPPRPRSPSLSLVS